MALVKTYTCVIEQSNGDFAFSFPIRVPLYTTAECTSLKNGIKAIDATNPIKFIDSTLGIHFRTEAGTYAGETALLDYCAIGYIAHNLSDGYDVSQLNAARELFPIYKTDLTDKFLSLPITETTETEERRSFLWYIKAKAGYVQKKFGATFRHSLTNNHSYNMSVETIGNYNGSLSTFPVARFGGAVNTAYNTNLCYTDATGLIIDGDTQIVNSYCRPQHVFPYGGINPSGTVAAFGLTTNNNGPFAAVNTANTDILTMWRNADEATIIDTDDPYAPGGESESGGGDGNFDFSSTVIPIPGLPNIGATDTGFISLYKPSATQLKALANYMWAGAFDVAQFKKLFADPMDAILGLHIIPTVAGHPTTGSGNLLVGNIDTGLTMPTCLEQYYEADFGEVAIPAKWGAYLDYSPYTKLSLYLPYIGFVPLSADDCMRGSIKVVYHVDVLSGTCMAFVYCVSNRGADGHTLYMFNGSCSCDCPVTSGQYRSALEGLLGVAGSIGRVAAGDVAGGLKDAISNVTSMLKPEIGRSGSFGGSGGLMGIQYPYLVLTVPRMAIPGQQNTFIGYPSFVTKTIGDLTGYCSIDVSHLNNMPCTQAETDEIISLLGEGVIL